MQSRVKKEVFICSQCADIVKKLHFKEEYGEETCRKLAWKEKRGAMEGKEETDLKIPSVTPREIHGAEPIYYRSGKSKKNIARSRMQAYKTVK